MLRLRRENGFIDIFSTHLLYNRFDAFKKRRHENVKKMPKCSKSGHSFEPWEGIFDLLMNKSRLRDNSVGHIC
jgi:hypothetical protein